jgi:hypothetical protein
MRRDEKKFNNESIKHNHKYGQDKRLLNVWP